MVARTFLKYSTVNAYVQSNVMLIIIAVTLDALKFFPCLGIGLIFCVILVGSFTFQAQLYRENGTIVFAYKDVSYNTVITIHV